MEMKYFLIFIYNSRSPSPGRERESVDKHLLRMSTPRHADMVIIYFNYIPINSCLQVDLNLTLHKYMDWKY